MTEATKKHFTNLVTKWNKAAEKERAYAIEAKRNRDLVIAEGCYGRLESYRTCINDLLKLLDQCGGGN